MTSPSYANEIQEADRYLNSPAALHALDADTYWPKWNSTWWHMLLLHEMGMTKHIPPAIVHKYVEQLSKKPLKIFPIHPEEMPAGFDLYREGMCHCQLGNAYQVLAAWGIDVDEALPWIRPWFLTYQMADGGLSCDHDAYLVKGECPSSMVGFIAVFEAILFYTPRAWTAEEVQFLEKGAAFLMGRQLIHGSSTEYNAEERASAELWPKLCFPRFYFYDVLRGLHALAAWSEKTKTALPVAAIQDALTLLKERSVEGELRTERLCYQGVRSISQTATGEWLKRQPAEYFPLLTKVSAVGEVSPFLTKQWAEVKVKLRHLTV